MSPPVTHTLILFLVLCELLAFVDLLQQGSVRRFFIQTAALLVVVVILHLTAGFPKTRQPFGGVRPEMAIALMFVCVLLGIGARYIFYLKSRFVWRDFAQPLVISPIVLLPLLGSIQGTTLESLQMTCFAVLAFQNGFFWQQVLEHAKPTT